MTHRITLVALDKCFASGISGTIDLLNTANMVARRLEREAPFEWQVLSADGRPVRASNGYNVPVDGALNGALRAKVVLIPAFGSAQPEKMVEALKRSAGLFPWLKAQYESGAILASTCSGSFLLAECGLLDGKPATTSWWLAATFRQRYPKVELDIGSMLTDAGRLICSGTGMSHIDLALHLIARFAGRDVARACAKYVVIEDQRRSQARYIVLNHLRSHDPLVARRRNG